MAPSNPRKHITRKDSVPLQMAAHGAEEIVRRFHEAFGNDDIPAFRLAAAQSVVESALEEITSLLNTAAYTRDLSLDEAFIARTRHLFSAASAVYATSVDRVSAFWINPQHRAQAEAYTAAQPANTVRLFVFSSPASAHEHRNVLAAHARRYNSSGAVLICTAARYSHFLSSVLQRESTDPLSHDFALLLFGDQQPPRLYEAVLSRTTLSWHERAWDRTTYETKLIAEFDSMLNLRPGDFHDGFLRWDSEFSESTEAWKASLEKLFLSEQRPEVELQNGDVFHIVFFAVNIDQSQLTDVILQQVKGKLELLEKKDGSGRLIKELWFGSRSQTMTRLSVHDGRYQGTLHTTNHLVDRFPFCMIVRFANVSDLKEYYEHETHSSVRQQIYSLCSDNAKTLYSLLANGKLHASNSLLPKAIYQAIEAAVDDSILRADYLEHDSIEAIVRRNPAPFSFP